MEQKNTELTVLRSIPDLVIQRVPGKTNKAFKQFAKEDFCGDYGMTLKFLMDFYTGVIQSGLEEVEAKVDFCMKELSKLQQEKSKPEQKFKIMANGVKLPLPGE